MHTQSIPVSLVFSSASFSSSSSGRSRSHRLNVSVPVLICLVHKTDEDVLTSLPLSRSTHHPQISLKEFQYHSLEEKDIGHETTLKDSGIDTASSSTILNILSADPFKQVLEEVSVPLIVVLRVVSSCQFLFVVMNVEGNILRLFLADHHVAFQRRSHGTDRLCAP
jgi:hypothetical protein